MKISRVLGFILCCCLFGCTSQTINQDDIEIKNGTVKLENNETYVIYIDNTTNDVVKEKLDDDTIVLDDNTTYSIKVLQENQNVVLSILDNHIKVVQIDNG